jgi:hypothetical protein
VHAMTRRGSKIVVKRHGCWSIGVLDFECITPVLRYSDLYHVEPESGTLLVVGSGSELRRSRLAS